MLGLTIACVIGNCHWRGGSHRSRRWRVRYVHGHSVHMPARKAARPRASLRACASVDREATRMTVRRAQAGTKWTRAWAASARATLAVSERCIAENARTRQSSKDVACAFSKALCLVAQGQASCQMCAGVIAGTRAHAHASARARTSQHACTLVHTSTSGVGWLQKVPRHIQATFQFMLRNKWMDQIFPSTSAPRI